MYEVDFTGWERTPENIKFLKNNNFERRKFWFNRIIKAIKYKRYDSIWYFFTEFVKNSKHL